MIKKFSIALSFVLMTAAFCYAQDLLSFEETISEEKHIYQFPKIKPEASITPGYWYVDQSGSKSAGEYEYLDGSVSLAGHLRAYPFPSRVFLNLCMKNTKDYCVDARYAYGNLFLARFLDRTFFHNLETITLADPNASTLNPGIDVRDAGEKYGVQGRTNSFSLRVKAPDYPAHINFSGWLVTKEGTVQQRSLLGSGYYNNIVRTSQSRDVDQQMSQYTVGINSHIGPVEADVSHTQKQLDVKGDSFLSDMYASTTFTSAGEYPHNLIPEIKGSSTTFKLHTDYTGRLVASATVTTKKRENLENSSSAEYFSGSAGLTYVPMEKLNIFLRYSHKDMEVDNPDNPLKPSISSASDTVSLVAKYRLPIKASVRAGYTFAGISRDNADLWGVTDSTTKHTALLSADARPLKNLNIRADYKYRKIEDPAYLTEPDNADEGNVTVSWAPFQKLNAMAGYSLRDERRKDPHFDREAKSAQIIGGGSLILLKPLSLSVDYTNIKNEITQDIGNGVEIDMGIPYEDKTNVISVGLNFVPKNHIGLNGGVTYSQTEGSFSPASDDLLRPVSIASYSELESKETAYYLSGNYGFKNGFSVKADYRFTDLDDVIDNPYDDVVDGSSHTILLTASKNW